MKQKEDGFHHNETAGSYSASSYGYCCGAGRNRIQHFQNSH